MLSFCLIIHISLSFGLRKYKQFSVHFCQCLKSYILNIDLLATIHCLYSLGSPVTVGVTLYILSIGDLSEKFMDFTFDMYFRQFWSDNRLQFNGSNFGIDKLVVGAEYIRLIWVPDTFFVNEKVATFHKATTENQFLRISQNGDVLRSIRLTIKATCNMNLANFPMDDQLCTVEVESFGYTMADLR